MSQETAHDLAVVIDSQPSLSAQVAAVCRSGLQAAVAPTARPIYIIRGRKDADPGVHFLSPVLLQLTVLRHRQRSHEPAAVCPVGRITYIVLAQT